MKFFLSGVGLFAILLAQNAQAMMKDTAQAYRQYREEIAQAGERYSEQAEKEPDYRQRFELFKVYQAAKEVAAERFRETNIKNEQEYRAELEFRRKRNSPEDQEWLRHDRNMWILARH